jgi:hypothetical protein
MQLCISERLTMTVVICIPSCPMSSASACHENEACWVWSWSRKCIALMLLPLGCAGLGCVGSRRESGRLRVCLTASTSCRTSGCPARTSSTARLPDTRTVLRCGRSRGGGSRQMVIIVNGSAVLCADVHTPPGPTVVGRNVRARTGTVHTQDSSCLPT